MKSTKPAAFHRLVPFAVAVTSLWPLLRWRAEFAALHYFEDEWDLIDMWDKMGFARWSMATFAENFVPLFKLIWGGAIYCLGGGYMNLVVLLWLNHALNTGLLTRLMLRLGAGPGIACLIGLMFGLSPLHLETLGWTVQWSAVMSLTCMLGGLLLLAPTTDGNPPTPNRLRLVLASLASLASPLCFSRGVLTGFVLAIAAIFSPRWRRWTVIACTVLPAIAVALVVVMTTQGNHRHLAGSVAAIGKFSLYGFAQNPLRTIFSDAIPSESGIWTLAVGKIALFLIAWKVAPRPARPVLLSLVAFDVGNALLLGLGRHHTGLPAATSSRYQYAALLATLPALALVVQQVAARFAPRPRTLLTVSVVAFALWRADAGWSQQIVVWCNWRGRELRAALSLPADSTSDHFTRLPWMSNDRARYLIEKYNLH